MSKACLFPIIVFVLFEATFIGTYLFAISKGHVAPSVPYISDTAANSPESCFFGQLINIGCVLLGIVIYIRFRQVQQLIYHHPELKSSAKINVIALWLGIGSCLGCSMVANFQETNALTMHFIGAYGLFGLGSLYLLVQAYLTYNYHSYAPCAVGLAYTRFALAILCIILFVVVTVTGVIASKHFKGKDPRKWYPSDGGWEYHVVSSISEWILATLFCLYILTFTNEFKRISFDHPKVSIDGYEVVSTHV